MFLNWFGYRFGMTICRLVLALRRALLNAETPDGRVVAGHYLGDTAPASRVDWGAGVKIEPIRVPSKVITRHRVSPQPVPSLRRIPWAATAWFVTWGTVSGLEISGVANNSPNKPGVVGTLILSAILAAFVAILVKAIKVSRAP